MPLLVVHTCFTLILFDTCDTIYFSYIFISHNFYFLFIYSVMILSEISLCYFMTVIIFDPSMKISMLNTLTKSSISPFLLFITDIDIS